MFEIEDVKLIKDSVHGYIRIPKLFMEYIIDTPEFQRLRNVDQTGMKILYPNAKHDRFSHSLGVYHLGDIAVNALLKNFQTNPHGEFGGDDSEYVWAKNRILFLIACLLHDIAHAPFSHSLEQFYEFESTQLIEKLTKLMGLDPLSETAEDEMAALQKAAEHEKMSAYLILSEDGLWRGRIQAILEKLIHVSFSESVKAGVEKCENPSSAISDSELEEGLQFIARMIMGVKYSNYLPKYQIRNCFIELLNGSIDVDKLDYIVRDTKMSGINNVSLDIERLLGSLTIVPSTIYRNYTFTDDSPEFNETIIRVLDTNATDEVAIYGIPDREISIIEGEITVPTNFRISLKRQESNALRYLNYKAANFSEESGVLIGGIQQAPSEIVSGIPLQASNDGKKNLELKNARIINSDKTKNFTFTVSSNADIENQGMYNLSIHEASEEPISVNAKIELRNSKFTGRISGGPVKRLEVLSDELNRQEKQPSPDCYTGYSIGFNKQAASLISNVFDARNYLYLWIYSHHKVVYYANFLIVELARLALPKVAKQNLRKYLTSTITDDNEAYLLDEGCLHQYIRRAYKSRTNAQYKNLFEELISRKYHRSLYKSLAEYDLFFDCYSLTEKMEIRRQLEIISEIPPTDDLKATVESLKYGYIKKENLKKMKSDEIALSKILEDMIWIASKPSIKRADPTKILIVFKKEDKIVSMDRLPILSSDDAPMDQNHYFYLYYKVKSGLPKDVEDRIPEIIKKALISYLDKLLKREDKQQQK